MKPIDVKPDSYPEYNIDFNKKDLRFKIGDHVRISRHKSILESKFLLLTKLKKHFHGDMLLLNSTRQIKKNWE